MKKAILILLILILVISAFTYKWFYYRFYPFDRIRGTYEISISGTTIDAVEEYYEYENSPRVPLKSDGGSFKVKRGAYGTHIFGFTVSGESLYRLTEDEFFKDHGDIDFKIDCFNTNWWHIIKLDIKIDVINEKDEWYVCFDVNIIKPTEDFNKTAYNVSKKAKLTEQDSTRISVEI